MDMGDGRTTCLKGPELEWRITEWKLKNGQEARDTTSTMTEVHEGLAMTKRSMKLTMLLTAIGAVVLTSGARWALGQTVDQGFVPNISGGIETIALQPEGKILIGGKFGAVNGLGCSNLARLNPDGSLDPDFNPAADGVVKSIAVQADGRILVGGLFGQLGTNTAVHLGRLKADGSTDIGFAAAVTDAPESAATASVDCLALQNDGKILVGGGFTELNGHPCSHVARLNPDGSLDSEFRAQTDGEVECIAVQPDGKVLVGGSYRSLDGQPCLGLGRLNPDGTLDSSFTPMISYAQYDVTCLVLQPDGRLLVAGVYPLGPGIVRKFVCRLKSDGSLDPDFFQSGTTEPYLPRPFVVFSLSLQADGKIVVGGSFNVLAGEGRAKFGRLNSDGTLDTTFVPSVVNTNQPVLTTVGALASQADGKLIACGLFTECNGQACSGIVRLLADNAVEESLVVNPAGTRVGWRRNGAQPELGQVTFEMSHDGTNFGFLGNGIWSNAGWQLGGLSLPFGQRFYLRARGRANGGAYSASSGLVELVKELVLAPTISRIERGPAGGFSLAGAGPPGQACLLLTTEALTPQAQWTPIATNTASGEGLLSFNDLPPTGLWSRFYRVLLPQQGN
jgi:uncharacterized delta-60 repeat protein